MLQIKPRYKKNTKIHSLLNKFDENRCFFSFFAVNGNAVENVKNCISKDRAFQTFLLSKKDIEKEDAYAVLNKERKASNPNEKKLLNLFKIYNDSVCFFDYKNITAEVTEWHKLLLKRTGERSLAGNFRKNGNETVKDIKDEFIPPETEKLPEYWDGLLHLISKVEDTHPVLKSWIIYYYFSVILPFESENAIINRLLHNCILKEYEYGFNKLPVIEKQLIRFNDKINSSVATLLFANHYSFRMDTDITQYLELVLNAHLNSCDEAKTTLKDLFKKFTGFDMLNAEEKANINFIINDWYIMKGKELMQLNERQKGILHQLIKKGEAATKELALKFRCDRKTIQRDFNLLQDLKLVTANGKGRGVHYSIDVT